MERKSNLNNSIIKLSLHYNLKDMKSRGNQTKNLLKNKSKIRIKMKKKRLKIIIKLCFAIIKI